MLTAPGEAFLNKKVLYRSVVTQNEITYVLNNTYSLIGDSSQKENIYTQLDIFWLNRPFSRDTDKLN